MAAVLVTGGTGSLGRFVVSRLVADGHDVRSLSRRPEPAGLRSFQWITADLYAGGVVARAVRPALDHPARDPVPQPVHPDRRRAALVAGAAGAVRLALTIGCRGRRCGPLGRTGRRVLRARAGPRRPDVLRWTDLLRSASAARGRHRPVLPIPIPGRTGRAFRAGHNLLAPGGDARGGTFADYLAGE